MARTRSLAGLFVIVVFVGACRGSSRPVIHNALAPSAQTPVQPPGSASPTVSLPAMPVARLVTQVSTSGSGVAIAGYTPVLFDASASEGDRLSYTFDFGDGESTTTADSSTTHVYRTPGQFLSKVTVRDSAGRDVYEYAKERVPCDGLVDPRARTGAGFSWVLGVRIDERFTPQRRLTFVSQDGGSLRGYYTHPELNRSDFTATLSGERTLVVKLDDGTITFSGQVRLKGLDSQLSLLMRGGSADGQTLTFGRDYPYPTD